MNIGDLTKKYKAYGAVYRMASRRLVAADAMRKNLFQKSVSEDDLMPKPRCMLDRIFEIALNKILSGPGCKI